MPSHVETEEASLTQLVSGILRDAQELARQQLTLFQVEVRNDMRRTVTATIPMVAGLIVLFIGEIVAALAAGHWIAAHWQLGLWQGLFVVGGVLVVLGAVFLGISIAKFSTFNPLPDQTVQGLKENLQWKTKS